MSSVVEQDQTGDQITLDRSSWFSHECAQWIDEALDNPKIGTDKVLSLILHHGLGLSLETVARLQNTTKNIVTKRVITGTKRLRGNPPWRFNGTSHESNYDVTLAEWLEVTCANLGDLTENTKWVYSKVKADLIALLGSKLMGGITAEDMGAFREMMVARGLAPKTVDCRMSVARSLFRDAVRMGCIETNPCEKNLHPPVSV